MEKTEQIFIKLEELNYYLDFRAISDADRYNLFSGIRGPDSQSKLAGIVKTIFSAPIRSVLFVELNCEPFKLENFKKKLKNLNELLKEDIFTYEDELNHYLLHVRHSLGVCAQYFANKNHSAHYKVLYLFFLKLQLLAHNLVSKDKNMTQIIIESIESLLFYES
jgi:hypothetical protein